MNTECLHGFMSCFMSCFMSSAFAAILTFDLAASTACFYRQTSEHVVCRKWGELPTWPPLCYECVRLPCTSDRKRRRRSSNGEGVQEAAVEMQDRRVVILTTCWSRFWVAATCVTQRSTRWL